MNKLEFWNERASLGFKAGTNDEIMKYMEMNAISSYISDGMKVLDFGCGNGITMNYLAKKYDISIVGIDFSPNMISEAKKLSQQEGTGSNLRYIVGNEETLQSMNEKFDIIYSERALINLDSWEKQKQTILHLCSLLKTEGKYVMCESSFDGLQQINELRKIFNLEQITPPWHNRYFREEEVEDLSKSEKINLVEINHFSSTYYFLSRVINAALASQNNKAPSYDSPLNKLALSLPPIGEMGQGKIWVWEQN